MAHQLIIQLAIAYTLVGAFIFTVIITCGSLVGWISVSDKKQQQQLFAALIVQLLVIGVGYFKDFLTFSPANVANAAIASAAEKIETRTVAQALDNLKARSVSGTDNIDPIDVEVVVRGGKVLEALAIFTGPEASEVKRRQFAVRLVKARYFESALKVCATMRNRAEIKNVALAVVDGTLPETKAESGEWQFLNSVFNLLSDEGRSLVLNRLKDRELAPLLVWKDYHPAEV
jgi:hypothetical protein